MIRKLFFTVSLLLPAVVMSGVAHAGATGSGKRHGPYEAGTWTPTPWPVWHGRQYRGKDLRSCTYSGGPKSNLWTCR